MYYYRPWKIHNILDYGYLKLENPAARGVLSLSDLGVNVSMDILIEHLGEGQGLAKIQGYFSKMLLNNDTVATFLHVLFLISPC